MYPGLDVNVREEIFVTIAISGNGRIPTYILK